MMNSPPKVFTVAFLLLNLVLVAMSQGTQFITGDCTTDADCASGCCGFNSGTCAGPVVAQERDGGCGFGDAQPNDDAAQTIQGGQGQQGGAAATSAADAPAVTPNQNMVSNSTGGTNSTQNTSGGSGAGNGQSNGDAIQALELRNTNRTLVV